MVLNYSRRASRLYHAADRLGVPRPQNWPPRMAQYNALMPRVRAAQELADHGNGLQYVIHHVDVNPYRGESEMRFLGLQQIVVNPLSLNRVQEMLTATLQAGITDVVNANGLGPNDQIALRFVEHGGVDIFTGLQPLGVFDMANIFAALDRALQSAQAFDLSNTVVHIIWVKPRRGGGPMDRISETMDEINTYIHNAGSIIEIKTRGERNDCFHQCLALAEVERLQNKEKWDCLIKGRSVQHKREVLATRIREAVNQHTEGQSVGVTQSELEAYEQLLNLHIHIIDYFGPVFITEHKPEVPGFFDAYFLYVRHDRNASEGHFHYIKAKQVHLIFKKTAFCKVCRKGFMKGECHKCSEAQCKGCNTTTCEGVGEEFDLFNETCETCNCLYFNQECLDTHIRLKQCKKKKRCKTCSTVYKGKKHKCYKSQCTICKQWVEHGDVHDCYIQKPESEPEKVAEGKHKYIFYDYESCFGENGRHEFAMVCALEYNNDEPHVFFTQDAFMDWALTKSGYTFIAHNAGRYDSQFIKATLVERGIRSDDIMNGSTILSMTVRPKKEKKKNAIRFIDSYRFIPSSLRKFPSIFGLQNLEKGYFPYRFLTKKTLDYKGRMPLFHYFNFDSYTNEKDYEKACAWYEKHKDDEIDLRQIMIEYCRDDVLLLKRGCIEFQRIFLELSEGHIDPFSQITIASVCMLLYRMTYMPARSIGILNNVHHLKVEKECQKWLLTRELYGYTVEPVTEADRLPCGFDGIDRQKRVLFKFLGCYDYGCHRCFEHYTVHRSKCMNMKDLRKAWYNDRTEASEVYGYKVESIWECRWKVGVKNNSSWGEQLRVCDFETQYTDRLNPRNAFYGGRCEPTKLLVNGKKMRYLDYTSLYPSVQHGHTLRGLTEETKEVIHKTYYPVGQPEILHPKDTEISGYFGLIQCTVLPPRRLYHPVLPFRMHNKLMFCLCHSCARTYQRECNHTEEERALYGTWTSIELQLALTKGYRILSIDEVWHYRRTVDDLFRGYVEQFMILKQQSKGKQELLAEGQTECIETYVEHYYKDTGLKLDATKIPEEKNAGLYAISKLCLNSLWGKFGQRDNLGSAVDVFNRDDFEKYVFDQDRYEIRGIFLPNGSVTTLNYSKREDCAIANAATNVVICAFTTAHARMRLYASLDLLQERVCYYDTDSIVFIDDDTPIRTGETLGDLTDELRKGDYITDFVSTASKSYAYRTKQGNDQLKVKGITLNMLTKEQLTYDLMEEFVMEEDCDVPKSIQVSHMQFLIHPRRFIQTIDRTKKFRKTFDKRYTVLREDRVVDTLPYGY